METRGHKQLKAFMRRSELRGFELARLAGLTSMQVYHLINGRRRASLEVAIRLQDATRGAVQIRSWIEAA